MTGRLRKLPLFEQNDAIWWTIAIYAAINFALGALYTIQPGQAVASRAFSKLSEIVTVRQLGIALVCLGAVKVWVLAAAREYRVWPARVLTAGAVLFFFMALTFARAATAENWTGSSGSVVWLGLAAIHLVTRRACTRPTPPAQ